MPKVQLCRQRPRSKIFLTKRHKPAKEHENKPDEYWQHILRPDETKIMSLDLIGSSMFGLDLDNNYCSGRIVAAVLVSVGL